MRRFIKTSGLRGGLSLRSCPAVGELPLRSHVTWSDECAVEVSSELQPGVSESSHAECSGRLEKQRLTSQRHRGQAQL